MSNIMEEDACKKPCESAGTSAIPLPGLASGVLTAEPRKCEEIIRSVTAMTRREVFDLSWRAGKLLDSKEVPTRLAAVRLLAGCAGTGLPGALKKLVLALKDPDADVRNEIVAALTALEPLEAVGWLSRNKHSNALAGNRFNSTRESLTFVKRLYAIGANGVFIERFWGEASRIEKDGGPYADLIEIWLPDFPRRPRTNLIKMCNRERQREGFGPALDTGQDSIMLWWD